MRYRIKRIRSKRLLWQRMWLFICLAFYFSCLAVSTEHAKESFARLLFNI